MGSLRSSYSHIIFWILFSFAASVCIYKASSYTHNNVPDLRVKVVGARVMKDGIGSPYFYKWQKGDKDIYCNPYDRPGKIINGLSVPPSLLWMMYPLADLNYCSIVTAWFGIQAFLLLLTGIIVISLQLGLVRKIAASLIYFIFFLGAEHWFMHIEQGQNYAVYAFAFALLYLIYKKCKRKEQAAAITLAVYTWLRPLFLFTSIPFILKKQSRFLVYFIIAGFGLILLTTVLGQWKYWKDYQLSIKEYSQEVNGKLSDDTAHIVSTPPTTLENCVSSTIPTLVTNAGALYSTQKYLGDLGIKINNATVFSLLILILVSLFALLIPKLNATMDTEQWIVYLFLAYLIAELNTPAVRNPYNLVQWTVPCLLIGSRFKQCKLAVILMLAGFVLNTEFIYLYHKYQRELGELLLIAAACVFILKRNGSESSEFLPVSN